MEAEDQNTQNPSLYIGSYQQQLYVQESEAQLRQVVDGRVLNGELVYPKVNWKPYLISADSRTTVINHGNKPKHSELPMLEYQHTKTNDPNKALAVIGGNSEYPYDSGLYLYPDEPDLQTDLIEEMKNNVTEGKHSFQSKNFILVEMDISLIVSMSKTSRKLSAEILQIFDLFLCIMRQTLGSSECLQAI